MAINGKKYSFESIEVTAFGRKLAEVGEVNYKLSVPEEKTYVLGSKTAVAVTRGKEETEGSIVVTGDQYDEIQKSIDRGAKITDIEAFDVTVSRLDKDDTLMTDRLKQCRFMEIDRAFSTENPHDKLKLPLSIGDIEYNI